MTDKDRQTLMFFLGRWLQQAEVMMSRVIVGREDWSQAIYTEHYALTSLVMARRFASGLAPQSKKTLKDMLTTFLEETKLGEDVRDMREHSDHYFVGKGRKQDSFVNVDQYIHCDMSSTIVDDRGHMFGGIVAAESLLSSVQKLRSAAASYLD